MSTWCSTDISTSSESRTFWRVKCVKWAILQSRIPPTHLNIAVIGAYTQPSTTQAEIMKKFLILKFQLPFRLFYLSSARFSPN